MFKQVQDEKNQRNGNEKYEHRDHEYQKQKNTYNEASFSNFIIY